MPKNNIWGCQHGFILASGSPQRKRLLENAGFYPSEVVSADIDETPHPGELPARYVVRVATEKAKFVFASHPTEYVLAADTVIAVGKRIIRKSKTAEEAAQNLHLLSGRRHRVMTGFCVISPTGKIISKLVQTAVILKSLDESDIRAIIDSEEWKNVAGYKIEGVLSACVRKIVGSHPNIVGLPIFEVAQVLKGLLRSK